MLNFVAIDLQLYKILKITRVSFLAHSVEIIKLSLIVGCCTDVKDNGSVLDF